LVEQVNDKGAYKALSDDELVRIFSNGDSRHPIFLEIVNRYKVRVYAHIRRIVISHDDADDASQNTFIKVWENLGTFRGDCALFSWIYRIATNEALVLLRKKKPNISMDDVQAELGKITGSGQDLEAHEIQALLQKALLLLPEKQKIVFNLKYFDDLTYEQMADITGTSVGALKASYFHAVKKIEQFLTNRD
jgi:RNA polymerase sigma factor (sigma-70 family)